MTRFAVSQKTVLAGKSIARDVDRPVATVWYGKNRGDPDNPS